MKLAYTALPLLLTLPLTTYAEPTPAPANGNTAPSSAAPLSRPSQPSVTTPAPLRPIPAPTPASVRPTTAPVANTPSAVAIPRPAVPVLAPTVTAPVAPAAAVGTAAAATAVVAAPVAPVITAEQRRQQELLANAERIDKANRELLAKNQELQLQLENVDIQLRVLQKDRGSEDFRNGAIAIVVGFLMGWFFAGTRRQKSSW